MVVIAPNPSLENAQFVAKLILAWLIAGVSHLYYTQAAPWAEMIIARFSFGEGPHTLGAWLVAVLIFLPIGLLASLGLGILVWDAARILQDQVHTVLGL